MPIDGPSERCSRSVMPRTSSGMSMASCLSSCRRAKASMRLVRVEPRCAPCTALSSSAMQLGIVGQALAHQFEAAEHRHQQIVEVVGDAAGELPDRLHLLGLKQGLARVSSSFCCGFLALGDVAGDLGVAEKLSVVVADGVDDDMRPEAGAVLADAPAFLFEPSLSRGGLQRLLRLAGFPIFLRVELREVAADDFVGQVALDPSARRGSSWSRCLRRRACRWRSR